MKSSTVALLALSALVAACATKVRIPEIALDPPVFAKAEPEPPSRFETSVVTVPEPLPLPGQLKPLPQKAEIKGAGPEKPPEDRVADANAAAKIVPGKDSSINAMQVYPFTQGALYQLYAAVNQVSDIALEPGETLLSVSSGDTVRWVIGDTQSGAGASARTHILVKPIAADLATNLVIATDRRTYHLELTSTEKTYIASVSWTYPLSELVIRKRQAEAQAAAREAVVDTRIALDAIRFRYRIDGDAPWRPAQVFDDGNKVYIQFPSTLRQGEAPPLFIAGADGKPALVNYRVKGSTYIVDRLFAAAELRQGEDPQRIVRITRRDAQWREVWK
ncbi:MULTISPECIES: P-type conjugative transfer protein TrbG [Rhodomicrobium]|uniref:P-type conjugative transfer protein TrbG n=1 Tax=Rhodomicrobium TaxID=1068 RepID=UPI000B4B5A82|nr:MULTISPECIES: P-type conjugative transfer protein TrbG [Rhodomicrobium]